MHDLGYVNPDFLDHVLERDNASSTAFGAIALPHSIQMDAVRTCIAVIISKQGITWADGKTVHLVLLLSILDDEEEFEFLCGITNFSELGKLFDGHV